MVVTMKILRPELLQLGLVCAFSPHRTRFGTDTCSGGKQRHGSPIQGYGKRRLSDQGPRIGRDGLGEARANGGEGRGR